MNKMLWKYRESRNESFHDQGVGKAGVRLTGRWALFKCTREGLLSGRRGGGPDGSKGGQEISSPLEIHGWWFYKSKRISCQPSGLKQKWSPQCLVRSVQLWPGFDWRHWLHVAQWSTTIPGPLRPESHQPGFRDCQEGTGRKEPMKHHVTQWHNGLVSTKIGKRGRPAIISCT